MQSQPREILIFYNPASLQDRKMVAHAQSLLPYATTCTFDSANSSNWEHILEALHMHPKELMNKSHPYYQENLRGKDFDTQQWLDVIVFHPWLIKAPIAIRGDKAVLCRQATDVYKIMEMNVPATIW